ncbi:hypothetical protein SSX86_028886 [Deinandra increscens subsp. villosa]|uniref:Protein FLX-like 3 n=1 Tax=Deinandra increscens subsp. villosa TaxID=3103831 RepID=A0AAP0GJP0_9ASTR
MSGRNRMPHVVRDGPMPVVHRVPGRLPPHPAVLEEELELQHHDIQRIVVENGHVVEENVSLQRELTPVKDEIHRLGQIIPKLHADREARARDLMERGRKLEAELRDAEPLKADVSHLRNEAQKLNSLRQDLSNQVQTLTNDTGRLRAENEQVVAIKSDIDGMRKDLVEMRRDYDMVKKTNEEHMVQKEAMEKNLISMAREIEKLRGEQMRARGLGTGGYGMPGGSPDMRYPSGGYGDVYGSGWGSYDHRGPPRISRFPSKPKGPPVPPSGPARGYSCGTPAACISRFPSKPKGSPIPPSGPAPGYSCGNPADCTRICPCEVSETHCTNNLCYCSSTLC